MRLVGLLLMLLGGAVVWWALQGQKPTDHARQLIDLFGHQHAPGQRAAAGAGAAGELLEP